MGFNAGAAFVYQLSNTTWTLVATLSPSVLSAGDFFGRAVSIDGDRVVVSAPGADNNGSNSGIVLCFLRNPQAVGMI